jgi:hypothetical protein
VVVLSLTLTYLFYIPTVSSVVDENEYLEIQRIIAEGSSSEEEDEEEDEDDVAAFLKDLHGDE